MKIDAVIMGSDSGPLYRDFWPLVASAWRKMGIEPVLGYVGKPPKGWGDYGTIVEFEHQTRVPDCNMAKISRILIASSKAMRNKCVMLSDLDMLPLRADYFLSATILQEEDTIRNISADACTHYDEDRYPICYWIGKGIVFQLFFNPRSLSSSALIDSWINNIAPIFDDRENPSKLPFSDESLIKRLLWSSVSYPERVDKRFRGWVGATNKSAGLAKNRLDRADWRLDMDKLKQGGYIDSHLVRPLQENIEKIRPLAEYLGLGHLLK